MRARLASRFVKSPETGNKARHCLLELISPARKRWVFGAKESPEPPSGGGTHATQLHQFRLPHCLQHQTARATDSCRPSIPAVELPRRHRSQPWNANACRRRHLKPRPSTHCFACRNGAGRRGTDPKGKLQPLDAGNINLIRLAARIRCVQRQPITTRSREAIHCQPAIPSSNMFV